MDKDKKEVLIHPELLQLLIQKGELGNYSLTKRQWMDSIKRHFGFKSDEPARNRLRGLLESEILIPSYVGYRLHPSFIVALKEERYL